MQSKAVRHLSIIKKNDEYGTPITSDKPLHSFKDAVKCSPRIDYFASKSNHVLKEYLTKKDNALEYAWTKNGFINPPYSKIKKVMKKAYEEHRKNNVELMILTYNKTDTEWWHRYVENCPNCEVHFVKGRIRFLNPRGKLTKLSAPYPSCWIIYRRMIDQVSTDKEWESNSEKKIG